MGTIANLASAFCLIGMCCSGCSNEPAASNTAEPTAGPVRYGAPTPEFINAIAVDTPTASHPVSFGGTIAPAAVGAGEAAILVIRTNTAPKWHINTVGRESEMLIPTSLKLAASDVIQPVDDWQLPSAHTIADADGPVYQGDFVFFHHLRVNPDAPAGTYTLSCTIEYQACDNMRCLAPASEKLSLTVNVN